MNNNMQRKRMKKAINQLSHTDNKNMPKLYKRTWKDFCFKKTVGCIYIYILSMDPTYPSYPRGILKSSKY